MWDILMNEAWLKDGIPTPQMTLDWKYPYMKEKKDFVKKFTRITELKKRLLLEDLGIDLNDAYKGVFLDYTHEDDLDSNLNNKIISIGMGKDAKVFQDQIKPKTQDFLSPP